MYMTILLTFVFTVAVCMAALCFAVRRVVMHLRGNAVGTAAVVDHVLLPIFGRQSRTPVAAPEARSAVPVPVLERS